MFFDERIHSESGRIYERGIFFAMLITFLFAVLRALPLIRDGEFTLLIFTTELFILIAGIGILLYAALRFRGEGDERTIKEKHDYFVRAGWIFLLAALAGYAFAIVFSAERGTGDAPANALILLLELLGVTYFFYSFKSRDISFNYSFIGEKRYYSRVFMNIAKLAAILAVPFFFAAWLDLLVHGVADWFVAIILSYVLSVFGLGLFYLYISVIERLSYADESEALLKKGTKVSMIVYFCGFVLSSVFQVLYRYVVTELSMNQKIEWLGSLPAGQIMQTLSYSNLYFSYLLTILNVISLCHLLSAVFASRLAKDVICFQTIFGALSILWTMDIRVLLVSNFTQVGEEAWWALTMTSNVVSNALTLGANVLLFVLLVALWKDFKVNGLICFLPILRVVGLVLQLVNGATWFGVLAAGINGALGALFYIGFYLLLCQRDRSVLSDRI